MTFDLMTYRRPFVVDSQAFEIVCRVGMKRWSSRLLQEGVVVCADETDLVGTHADFRNHRLRLVLADGREVEVEVGFRGWWTVGIAVRVDGSLAHESHPGHRLGWPLLTTEGPENAEQLAALKDQNARDEAQWNRNKPSLIVDLCLGLLFFAVGKVTGDLNAAALVGAGVGLGLVVVQRFVKMDLLGGLAMFGVFTMLLSAAFSLWFQDERMVQLKGTILGVTVASFILGDALLNRGRYFGARVARYVPGGAVDHQRLAFGLGGLGLTMAVLNVGATHFLSKDGWLFYTTFVDMPLACLLGLLVLRLARARG
jgi:intracellular septation protein A